MIGTTENRASPPPSRRRMEFAGFVDVGGLEQWVTIRGDDRARTALLVLTGPGVGFCRLAPFFAPLESSLTLIQWDAPLAGVTEWRHRGVPIGDRSVARLASDAAVVASHARALLGVPTVAVLGLSAGTLTALHLLKDRPDLVSAYVGAGQVVNWARQASLGYAATLAEARVANDASAIAALEAIGPPPYADAGPELALSAYTGALTPAELRAIAALPPEVSAGLRRPIVGANYLPAGYTEADTRAVALKAYGAFRDELMGFDAAALGGRYARSMSFIQGEFDRVTDSGEVRAFAASLECPSSRFTSIEGSGHSAFFQRDRFFAALRLSLGLAPGTATPD